MLFSKLGLYLYLPFFLYICVNWSGLNKHSSGRNKKEAHALKKESTSFSDSVAKLQYHQVTSSAVSQTGSLEICDERQKVLLYISTPPVFCMTTYTARHGGPVCDGRFTASGMTM